MKHRPLHSTRGVTILELLVVVAIIGILSLLTLPNIPEIIRGHRLRTANNDIVSKLRYIRGLAISKNRELEVTIDPVKQTLLVWQTAYTEYNLIDELNNFDLNKAATDSSTSTTRPGVEQFKIFSEPAKKIQVIPRWYKTAGAGHKAGDPIYEIPINYDFLQMDIDGTWLYKDASELTPAQLSFIRSKSGVRSMTVNGSVSAIGKVTFMPSGIIKEMKVEIGIGSKDKNGVPDASLATGFIITVYKGGQIMSSSL